MSRPCHVLTHAEARRFYDRFGARQDSQAFYEGPALADLMAHLVLEDAHAVVEFGCGTGKFAADILAARLPSTATYLGLDISATMVALANDRLRPYGRRARVLRTDGTMHIPASNGAFDRAIATYVLDLLSEDDIRALLAEFARVLAPGGLLGIVSLAEGRRGMTRAVTCLWKAVHRLAPSLVGGCRPLETDTFLDPALWRCHHRKIVTPFGIASEILVVERQA